ncbi:hypothetical protein ACHQM5_010009 [Ranunculus cassubicifolius]
MGESSASYIRVVQHLIEKCLLFDMSEEECIEALSKHANITPVITSTVWKELVKENKDFFEGYWKKREERLLDADTKEMIRKILTAESSTKDSKD